MCVLELCKENHAHSEWKSGPELKHGLAALGKGNIYSKEVLAWKGFAQDLTELMTRERRKNYLVNTSIYLLNPDTATRYNWYTGCCNYHCTKNEKLNR